MEAQSGKEVVGDAMCHQGSIRSSVAVTWPKEIK